MIERKGTPLNMEMRARLTPILSALGDGLSEYCFSNLFLFRHVHDYSLIDDDYPCISGRTYDGKLGLIPLFDMADPPDSLLKELLGGHDFFFPISVFTLGALDRSRFEISHWPADADYIYPAENFIHYRGEKLRKKRNLMNQYLAGGTAEAFPLSLSHLDDARQVLEDWQKDKNKETADTDYHPCQEALIHFGSLDMIGYMHYRDREPTGFLLGNEVWPGIFAIHFTKGSTRYHGVFQYMFHHLAMAMKGRFSFYNFEQDLGIANMQKTKLSYRPSRMFTKYRLKPL